MKNITITLDEKLARWARIRAAEQESSLSRWIAEMLQEKMLNEQVYQTAMQRYLAKVPQKLSEADSSYPSRLEIHER